MDINPDTIIYWQWGVLKINATLVYTWLVMGLLVVLSVLITRNLSSGTDLSRGQNILETIIAFIQDQIQDVTQQKPYQYLPFIGTLYLLIALANLLSVVPGYHPPTGSISTTAALALSVFFAVPLYGVANQGVIGFLKHYVEPTPVMLPFNVMGEISRTLALAVRLFGNVLSGTVIAAILLSIVPLFFPVVMRLLELLVGQVQAYIFAILATVYIGSASRAQGVQQRQDNNAEERS